MEAEEIYINQEASMQAAAFTDKHRAAPANKKGEDDPNYENITLASRKQDHPKASHLPPKSEAPAPAWSRPSLDSAQAPRWLHRAMASLQILLALLSITLLVWVLVNNSEMSQELLALKAELSNVSISARECEERQEKGFDSIQRGVTDAKQLIQWVKSKVLSESQKLKTLPEDTSYIKTKLQQISEMLEKMSNPQPTPQ